MPDLEWNKATWARPGQWPDGGDGWSGPWGGPKAQWYGSIYPRISRWLPAARVLEIAPGYGRWTQFLLNRSQEYFGVDYSSSCVEQCAQRFAAFPRAVFINNDGKSLDGVPDGEIDFCFSFDSLVHVELDVMEAYCAQIVRKLGRTGVAFIHHSNALAGVDHQDAQGTQGGRAITVSAALIKHIIEKSGGRVIIQEEINWLSQKRIDCLTTFSRDNAYLHLPFQLIQNDNFTLEASLISASISHYY